MNPLKIPAKIATKALNYALSIFNIDKFSYAKIKSRDDLTEIGTQYGGWVIPMAVFNQSSICYCAGCGEDISFDLGLIDTFGCDVYGFDPTPRAIEHVKQVAGQNNKYHFYVLGLWNKEDILKFYMPKNPDHVSHSLVNLQKTEDYISVKVNTLKNIMKNLGHDSLDLLKLDIEGAEYKVIESIIADGIDIKVLCVEYDECFNPLDNGYKERIRASINSLLENNYTLICAQGNGNYTFLKNS